MPTFTPVDDDPFSPSPTPSPAPSTAMPKSSAAPALVPVDHDPFATGETSAPLASPAAGVGSAMPADAASGEISAMPSSRASQPTSALPSRGIVTDVLTAIPRGAAQLVETGARAFRAGQTEEEAPASSAVIDYVQSLPEKVSIFKPSKESEESLARRAVTGGVESAITSFGAGLPGAVVAQTAAPIAPGAAAVAGFAASAGTVFGFAEYDRFLEEARQQGIVEKLDAMGLDGEAELKSKAAYSAIVEGGVEALTDLVAGRLLGIGKTVTEPVKASIRQSLAVPFKTVAKRIAKTGAVETATEMVQGEAESALRRSLGMEAAAPGVEAVESIGPTLVMSSLLGLGAHGYNSHVKRRMVKTLENPEADQVERERAALAIGKQINATNPELAKFWMESSGEAIKNGNAIDLDEDIVTRFSRRLAGEDVSAPPTATATDQNLDMITGQAVPPRAEAEPTASESDKFWEEALQGVTVPEPEAPGETPFHALDLTAYQPTSGPTRALKETYLAGRQEAAQGAEPKPLRSTQEDRDKAARILNEVLQEMTKDAAAPPAFMRGQTQEQAPAPATAMPESALPPSGATALPPTAEALKSPATQPGQNELPAAPANLPSVQAEQITSALPEVAKAAHQAATSPLNALPQPTQAQKEAGNYKKGHLSLQGLDIAIENPRGSVRSGVSPEGKPWQSTLKSHYGYLKGTVGADKDHVDTFIGPNPDSQKVYVVDQRDPKTGKFDEHKIVIGQNSMIDAQTAYLENYDPGWQGMGAITEMTMPEFKAWLKSGNTRKALAYSEPASKGKKALPGLPERSTSFNAKDRRSPDRKAWDAYDAAVAQGDTEKAKEIATRLAYKDRLTGLTRREGWEHNEAEGKHAQYAQRFFLDLDNFHDTNTQLGHEGGDLVLAYFGKLLRFHLGEGAEAARWGGDEFVGAGGADLEAKLSALQEDAASTVIPIDLKSGEHREQVGIRLSFGIGKDYAEAYSANTRAKEERKEAGLRHDRPAVPGSTGEKSTGGVEVRTTLPATEQEAGIATALPPGIAAELARPAVPSGQPLAEMTLDDLTTELAAGNAKILKYVRQAIDRLGKDAATDELFNKSFSKAIAGKTRPEFLSVEPALRALLNGESVEAAEKQVKPAEPETALPTPASVARVPHGTSKAAPTTTLPPAQPIAVGRKVQAKTERGTAVDAQFEVMNAADLVASHTSDLTVNPAYPKELQPRDRGRAASELQISNIMQRLEPEFLGESPKASEGAPIIGDENVVESGNGRVIAIKRLYERGEDNARRYRQWLTENAERFGLDRKTIENAKAPVLVRRRLSEVDREAFVKEANEQSVAAMSASEQALSDAKRLTPEVLAEFAPGEDGNLLTMGNREFIKSFMRVVVGQAEAGRYLQANGSISQEGVMRMRNAIFARAYGESDVLEKLAESTDSNVKNITNAMLMTAADFVKLRRDIELGERYALDISGDISAAVRKLSDLRDKGEPVKAYIDQIEIAPEISPLAKQILAVVDQMKRSAHKIAAVFRSYVEAVENLGNPHQEDMFGGTTAPSAMELFGMAIGRAENLAAEGPRYSLRKDVPANQTPLFTLDDFKLEVQEAPKPKKVVRQEALGLGFTGADLRAPERENKPVAMDELPLGKAVSEAEARAKQVGLPLTAAATEPVPAEAVPTPAPAKTIAIPIEKTEIAQRYAQKLADEYAGLRTPEMRAGYIKSSTEYFGKVYDAIQGKDIAKLKAWLHQGNQNSIRFFNEVAGIKVRTDKQIAEALRDMDPKAYDKLVSDQREADEKQKVEDAEKELQKLLADRKYNFNGKTVTAKEMIDAALADGFTAYSEKKRGITTVVTLAKGNQGYEFKTTSERTYIKRRLAEMKADEIPAAPGGEATPSSEAGTEGKQVTAADKRIAEIDKQLAALQARYERKAEGGKRSGMVPPSIKSDALNAITKLMDKLDAEKKTLLVGGEKPAALPSVGTVTPSPEKVGVAFNEAMKRMDAVAPTINKGDSKSGDPNTVTMIVRNLATRDMGTYTAPYDGTTENAAYVGSGLRTWAQETLSKDVSMRESEVFATDADGVKAHRMTQEFGGRLNIEENYFINPKGEREFYANLTKEQAGDLSPEQATGLIGPWWQGSEGADRTQTKDGREQLHRAWLRNTYNSDASKIPMEVLKSHAMDKPAFDAHDWFSREIWQRDNNGENVQPKAVEEININARHSLPVSTITTPAGAIKADAYNSRADSSIWFVQGDLGQIAFDATATFGGEYAPTARAKAVYAELKSARDTGWKPVNMRAGSYGTIWTLQKDGEVLTRAGAAALASGKFQQPESVRAEAGYDGMVDAQAKYSTRFAEWLATLPESTIASASALGNKISTTGIGDWTEIVRDKNEVRLWFKKDGKRDVSLAAPTQDQLLHEVVALAQQARDNKDAQKYEWGYGARDAAKERAKSGMSVYDALKSDGFIKEAPAKVSSVPEEKPSVASSLVAQHEDFETRLYDGKSSLDEFKSQWQAVRESREQIIEELSDLKKDELLKMIGGMLAQRYKSDKKERVVKAAYDSMLDTFTLGKSVSYMVGGNMERAHENAVSKMVDATTDDELKAFADKVAESRKARRERIEATKKAVENPQTLADFRAYMRFKTEGPAQMTEREAYLSLTPEQRRSFDALDAEEGRARRTEADRERRTTVTAAGAATDGKIIETKHTRDGYDLFVVQASERVDREIYNQWNTTAKRLGGWYSSFRGHGATPGFQFKTKEAAQAFLEFIGGKTDAAKAAVESRRDAFEDDRSQTAVERLTEMADRLDERADEKLSQDRRVNTDRRARMAASAEAAAESDKALAATMRNIAKAIESGEAKLLDRVRQKAQVEMLRGMLRSAASDERASKYPTYAEQEKHRHDPPTAESVDHAKFPTFTAYRGDLARLGRELEGIDGAKQIGQRILKIANDVTDEYLKFARENLHKVSTFTRKDGEAAIFASREGAEDAIRRSGFKGRAIVLPFKRGQNIIVMGPEMAKEHGLWQGDSDKRFTLSPDFGMEIVEKVKSLRRERISLPWVFERAAEERQRLKAMGIETASEFRSALREFVGLAEAQKQPDKVKELERSMVGRQKDGLDFFPTPESQADEMVTAADIKEGMRILEPSAGMGHIAERIRDAGVEPDVAEFSSGRRELLDAKGFNVVGQDFMDMRVDKPEDGYDRIIMNPPFSDRRDAQHVQHAYTLLKPGGRIVALMGEGVFFGQDAKAKAFREWLDSVGGKSEKLESGTFNDPALPVNTSVNARQVVIDKSMEGEDKPLYSLRKATPQTETPEFRAWFKDSKVVDEQGMPLVVYHGTSGEQFYTFEPVHKQLERTLSRSELSSGTFKSYYETAKSEPDLFFFTEDAGIAEGYADQGRNRIVMPVYLSVQDPVIDNTRDHDSRDRAIDKMLKENKDGAYFWDSSVTGRYLHRAWVVRRPEQVKSAGQSGNFEIEANSGAFSPDNPDIRYSRRRTESIDDIAAKWKKEGVTIDAFDYRDAKNTRIPRQLLSIGRIEVEKGKRKLGLGTMAMQDLTDFADANGLRMELSPDKGLGATSVGRLKAFYKRFGFVENSGRNKDFRTSATMYRRAPEGAKYSLRELPVPTFYSQLEKSAAAHLPETVTPEGLHAFLKRHKFRQDDVLHSGIEDFMAENQGKRIKKSDLLAYIGEKGAKIVPVEFGKRNEDLDANRKISELESKINTLRSQAFGSNLEGEAWTTGERMQASKWADDANKGDEYAKKRIEALNISEDRRTALFEYARLVAERYELSSLAIDQSRAETTKFDNWKIPGESIPGSYVEHFETVPNETPARQFFGIEDNQWNNMSYAEQQSYEQEMRENYKNTSAWKDGHAPYSEVKNPIVRWRGDGRTSADGKKTFFIHEIQAPSAENQAKMPKWAQKRWREIGLKSALDYAVKNGYDSMALATGEQVAGLYDLSKQVDRITYFKTPDGYNLKIDAKYADGDSHRIIKTSLSNKDLEDQVGKEIARKIIDTAPDSEIKEKTLSGLDLKVGGEGIKKLYDRDLPGILNDMGKKFGVKVSESKMATKLERKLMPTYASDYIVTDETGFAVNGFNDESKANDTAARLNERNNGHKYTVEYNGKEDVLSSATLLPISPAMRDSILTEGQPLFRRSAEAKGIPVQDAQAVIGRLESKHPGIIGKISVVADENSLPADIAKDVQSRGFSGEIEGVYYQGRVFVVAGNLESVERVQRVAQHELTHKGLRNILGNKIKPVFRQIYADHREAVNAVAKEYGLDVTKPGDRMSAVDEFVARNGENQVIAPNIIQKIIAMVRQVLRDMGFTVKFSDSDIMAMAGAALKAEGMDTDSPRYSLRPDQLDIFGGQGYTQDNEVQGDERADADRDVEAEKGSPEVISKIARTETSSVSRITSPADAAHVVRYLSRYPQERQAIILVNEDGDVLGIHEHSAGLIGETSVDPKLIVGQALNTPGAAKFWMAHQHPSGVADASANDIRVTQAIANLAEQSGVSLAGSIVVARDQFKEVGPFGKPGSRSSQGKIAPLTGVTHEIPVVERVWRNSGAEPGERPAFTDNNRLLSYAKAQLPKGGVLFLGVRNDLLSTMPLPSHGWTVIRGFLQSKLLKEAERRNATQIAVYDPTRNIPTAEIMNLNRFGEQANLRVLDVLDAKKSARFEGLLDGHGDERPFYSLSSQDLGKIDRGMPVTMTKERALFYLDNMVKYGNLKASDVADSLAKSWITDHAGDTIRKADLLAFLRGKDYVSGRAGQYDSLRPGAPEAGAGAGPDAKAAAARLETAINRGRRPGTLVQVAAVQPGDAIDADTLARFGKVFGKEIVYVKYKGGPVFDALVLPSNPDTIYIDAATPEPHLALVGHELVHTLAIDNNDLYKKLVTYLADNVKDYRQYKAELDSLYEERGEGALDDRVATQELIGDFVGNRLADPSFMRQLAQKEPTLFQRVADVLRMLVAKIGRAVGFKSENLRYWQDIQRAQDVATSVLAEYAQSRQAKPLESADLESGATRFSLAGRRARGFDKAQGRFSDLADRKERFEIDDSGARWVFPTDKPINEEGISKNSAVDSYVFGKHDKNGDFQFAAAGQLGDILKHDALFENYPEARDISVHISTAAYHPHKEESGVYSHAENAIAISADSPGSALKILLHELQHAIQRREGFASGGSVEAEARMLSDIALPEKLVSEALQIVETAQRMKMPIDELEKFAPVSLRGLDADAWTLAKSREDDVESLHKELDYARRAANPEGSYRRLAGEEEARRVAYRADMTAEERMGTPYERSDLGPGEERIVRTGGGVAEAREPSNLNAFQREQVATPEFKKWFGDSKVVDERGDPLVVYHGTNKNFEQFEGLEITGWFSESPDVADRYTAGRGIEDESTEGPNIQQSYLSIKKPLDLTGIAEMEDDIAGDLLYEKAGLSTEGVDKFILDYQGPVWETVNNSQFAHAATMAGYDGVKVKERGVTTWAIFDPRQAKSATANTGEFSEKNSDIRYSLRSKDAEYMAAVKRGDTEAAQKMVDEAAREAGYWLRKDFGMTWAFRGIGITPRELETPSALSKAEESRIASWLSIQPSSGYSGTMEKQVRRTPDMVVWKSSNYGMDSLRYVARDDNGDAAGYLIVNRPSDENKKSHGFPKVAILYTRPDMRGKGIATSLLAEALKDNNGELNADITNSEGALGAYKKASGKGMIKSADPITRDDQGNVIPLSERFKSETADIRYSLRPTPAEMVKKMTSASDRPKFQTVRAMADDPKAFAERYRRAFDDRDISEAERIYNLPHWIGQQNPEFGKMMDVEEHRQESRQEMQNDLLAATLKKNEGEKNEFLGLSRESKAKVARWIVKSDAENRVMTNDEMTDLTTDEKSAYWAWRKAMHNALETRMTFLERMNLLPYEGRPWFEELEFLSRIKGAAKEDVKAGQMNEEEADAERARYYEQTLSMLPVDHREAFSRAYDVVMNGRTRIAALRKEIGEIKFYMPRQREGEYVAGVYDPSKPMPEKWDVKRSGPWQGEKIWEERATNKAEGTANLIRLQKEFPGMTVVDSIDKRTPEEVYQSVNDVAIEKFVEKALADAKGITEDEAVALRDSMLETAANEFRERGWEKHGIHRGKRLIGGYQTEKLDSIFVSYMTGLAGSLTKMEAAYNYAKALEGVDMRTKPNLYSYSQQYVKDMLRNQTKLDRWSGRAKSVAFTWYITGKLSMAAVQLTQNYVTGVPHLSRYTKGAGRRYNVAMRDIALSRANDEERAALAEFHDKGLDHAKFMEDIMGKNEVSLTGVVATAQRWLAMPFTLAETFNRKSAFLAAYRVFRDPKNAWGDNAVDKDAFNRAKQFVSDTHYLMSKANKPEWARGASGGHAVANTAYTFASFGHNFALGLVDAFKRGGNAEGLAVLGRTMAYLVVFGGVGALPFLDDILDELERITGIPFRAQMRKSLKGFGGEYLARAGMQGIPALLGADLSGSIKMGVPFKEGLSQTAYGVYGGLYNKATRGFNLFMRGDWARGLETMSPLFLENALKAGRMATRGATTPSGKAMFDAEGKPIKLTPGETAAQAVGLRPARTAEISQDKRVARNIESYFKDERDDIYQEFRLAKTAEERQRVFKKMRQYNAKAVRYRGAIPLITSESLRRSAVQRPGKRSMQLERAIE